MYCFSSPPPRGDVPAKLPAPTSSEPPLNLRRENTNAASSFNPFSHEILASGKVRTFYNSILTMEVSFEESCNNSPRFLNTRELRISVTCSRTSHTKPLFLKTIANGGFFRPLKIAPNMLQGTPKTILENSSFQHLPCDTLTLGEHQNGFFQFPEIKVSLETSLHSGPAILAPGAIQGNQISPTRVPPTSPYAD